MDNKTTDRILDMAGKAGEALSATVQNIANSLGIAAKHMYEIYAKQMVIEGAVALLMICAVLFFGIKLTKAWINHTAAKNEKGERDKSDLSFAVFVSGACWIIPVIMIMCELPIAIGKLLNPEYYVIQKIIEGASKLL